MRTSVIPRSRELAAKAEQQMRKWATSLQVAERLAKGAASGYEFLFAEQGGRMLGYACYGRIPLTLASFDLYWIVVDSASQGQGIGSALVGEMERRVRGRARLIVVETAGRPDYAPTRAFYA